MKTALAQLWFPGVVAFEDEAMAFLQTSLLISPAPGQSAQPPLRAAPDVPHLFLARRLGEAVGAARALMVQAQPWWVHLLSIPLLIVCCLLLHRGLFRPFNWLFVAFLPFSLVGVVLLALHPDWPAALSAAALSLLLALTVLVRHAHTPEASIQPAGGWPAPGSCLPLTLLRKVSRQVHSLCVSCFRPTWWFYVACYLGLGASVLVGVAQEATAQRYANAFAGLFLAASIPIPNHLFYQYPLVHIRRWNMAPGLEESSQARELTEGAPGCVDEWYVAADTGQEGGDLCCRMPWSWVLLYSSWYLCSAYCSRMDSIVRVLALLLASLLDAFGMQLGQIRRGVVHNPFQTHIWVQSRLVTVWSYYMFEGFSDHFLARHMHSEDWWADANQRTISEAWEIGNLLWGAAHLFWFLKRAFWFRRLAQARSTWLSEQGELRQPPAAAA